MAEPNRGGWVRRSEEERASAQGGRCQGRPGGRAEMGKHKDRAKKQKARASNRKNRYGTDSYDTGSSEFSGDDGADYRPFADADQDEDTVARDYINEQSSTCGRLTSAFFCLATLAISGLSIYWAKAHAPGDKVDCGEKNPLNVSYTNWLVICGVSAASVFLMQLLVAMLACTTKPDIDFQGAPPLDGRDAWKGPIRSSRELKMGARRIACASFLIMVLGSIFVTWLGYGMWVFMAPIDIYNNGTTVSSVGAPREVFASDDCFQLHKFGFVLEIVGSVYVLLFIVSRCCVGVGFCKAMTLLKPVLS